uniref:Collagen-like protein n=1 Tax=Meloidogyne hapla TaxID=6305 RepID=A0A1I8BK14_MELHA
MLPINTEAEAITQNQEIEFTLPRECEQEKIIHIYALKLEVNENGDPEQVDETQYNSWPCISFNLDDNETYALDYIIDAEGHRLGYETKLGNPVQIPTIGGTGENRGRGGRGRGVRGRGVRGRGVRGSRDHSPSLGVHSRGVNSRERGSRGSRGRGRGGCRGRNYDTK